MEIDGVTSCMKIREVNENKKQFISLLLLADEQAVDYDKYYLYSLITHSTAIEALQR